MSSVVRVRRRADLAKRRETGSTHNRGSDAPAGLPMLRTSERATFKRCRWKWWWEFENQTKGRATPALRFGRLIHGALAAYYQPGLKRGPKPWLTFEQLYEEETRERDEFGMRDEDDNWVKAGDLGDAMLRNYVDRYGKDDEWEVLVSEQTFQTLIYHEIRIQEWPYTRRVPWFWYVGTVDGVWKSRRTKRTHIVDHKTAAAIVLQYLSLDDQATAYWTFGLDWIYENGLLKPTEKPAGMLFNILRKAMPDERPTNEHGEALNKNGAVSKRQPVPNFARVPIYRDFNERESARERILVEFDDMEEIRVQGVQEGSYETKEPPPKAYKNPGQFTCLGCWLFDICELHEIGQDWSELRDMTTTAWDPYEAHEIYTAETK